MASPAVAAKRGPSLVLALTVIAIGVLCAVPSLIVIVVRVQRTIEASPTATPGQTSRRLTAGTWFIYQETGTRSGLGGFTFGSNQPSTLQVGDVTVTGPGGQQLPVSYVTVNETITSRTAIYTAVVQFDVPSAGTYNINVTTPDSSIIVARSLGDTFKGIIGFVLVGVLGGLVIAIGVVLLIVGIVRRSHAESRAPVPAWGGGGWGGTGPPGTPWGGPGWGGPGSGSGTAAGTAAAGTAAGWYPDATRGGRLRWWDGSRWTDHYT